ncbi:MAG: peptide/nickel transport system substrate-binding protein [Thermoleophilaceae bacterium]|jgi:peptide/nickel transport system substrate-binding protein|nr:peptide/nickel transport system substrate-binding protein [Thermoleophilaceae bacterium]
MRKRLIVLAIAVLMLVVTGCGGSSDKKSSGGGGGKAATTVTAGAKKGGHLDVLSAGDIDGLDPGYWYYQYDYMAFAEPTQRELYSWEADKTTPTADIADGAPQVSDGGKTITVKIRSGVKYSPGPVKRTVTAADFKYALERCFLPQVGNGYVNAYLGDISGVQAYKDGKAKEITGITAPDDNTLVIKFDKPSGSASQALALPCTVPVPKEYAEQYDKGKQSTYGQHQVFTGPYMIKGAESGSVKAGYKPGKRIDLVRNPNWGGEKAGDFRPAYLDSISFIGGNDLSLASRKILQGQSMISGDFAAPPTAIMKRAYQSQRDQVQIIPSGGNRYIGLNAVIPPFDDANVRKAVVAATNRTALIQTRGGPLLGIPATHVIPPGLGGFDEAGGEKGDPANDFYANPAGDMAVAAKYMKAAGFSSGKYKGPEILMVGDDQPPASKTGEAFLETLKNLGFKVRYRQVPHDVMYSKFCQVPKAKVNVCPNVGWGKDFFDSESMLFPTFYGKNIVPSGNVNYPQLNDPKINKMMEDARALTDQAARDKAWADVDKAITAGAYVVMWIWDNDVNIRSKNVNGVQNKFNASWDVTYTSLK